MLKRRSCIDFFYKQQVAYELLLAHKNEDLKDQASLTEFVDQCKVNLFIPSPNPLFFNLSGGLQCIQAGKASALIIRCLSRGLWYFNLRTELTAKVTPARRLGDFFSIYAIH